MTTYKARTITDFKEYDFCQQFSLIHKKKCLFDSHFTNIIAFSLNLTRFSNITKLILSKTQITFEITYNVFGILLIQLVLKFAVFS